MKDKERRVERKARGVCVVCGAKPPKKECVSCSKCMGRIGRYVKRSRVTRYLAGLCAYCGREPRIGVMGAECRLKRKLYVRKKRAESTAAVPQA